MECSAKIQTRIYQNRHEVIRGAFTSGYINQLIKTGSKLNNHVMQNNKWYGIISAAKTALGTDIFSSKIYEYLYVLGAIHADNLTITGKNIVQVEAIALYDYYNNLQQDELGNPYYYPVDFADSSQDHSIVHTPKTYTASEFKEILVNEHISLGSSIRSGTLYSWFYKQGLKMDDSSSYPAYVFARVIYLAVVNNKVKLLPNAIIPTPFYERLMETEVPVSA